MLIVLLGLVVALLAWGLRQVRRCRGNTVDLSARDDVLLLGLLVLAAFAMGAFLTYTLLGFR
jgi:hypothetical protein